FDETHDGRPPPEPYEPVASGGDASHVVGADERHYRSDQGGAMDQPVRWVGMLRFCRESAQTFIRVEGVERLRQSDSGRGQHQDPLNVRHAEGAALGHQQGAARRIEGTETHPDESPPTRNLEPLRVALDCLGRPYRPTTPPSDARWARPRHRTPPRRMMSV